MLPKEVSKKINNNATQLANLKPTFNFLKNITFRNVMDQLGQKLEIFESFGEGISQTDIQNWYLPRYKILLNIMSSKRRDNINLKPTFYIFRCFQLLLLSSYCFQLEKTYSFKKCISQTLLYSFIRKEMWQIYQETGQLDTFMEFHSKTIVNLINLRLQAAQQKTQEQDRLLETIDGIQEIFFLLESIVHVLISLRVEGKPNSHNGSGHQHFAKAYYQIYSRRKKMISNKYTNDIQKNIVKHSKERAKLTQFLWRISQWLLLIIDLIDWARFSTLFGNNDPLKTMMEKSRTFIQAAILTFDDKDLITHMRLMAWPFLG
ncbi:hypothetical protein NCAS_0E01740 [Naumovozyma castellii]|uniref:Uncharacterized protein n=1 Tax=Naumovozyma castellii TaxID=27288 RepID=G0VFH8_NAUCA|nr:hypothetical protein NCAS_0E01740 [Naumovozyma castellii CBS 4309]CCC70244.1 hypothetical protein NCAS_0E01740 [Naumovozyma castellii CBS 4309]